MKKINFLLFAFALLAAIPSKAQKTLPGDVIGRGFYKDIFVDGGIQISSRQDLPAARYLNLQLEYFNGNKIAIDTVLQERIYKGCPTDENGILLYPDGAPRFRMIYTHGGLAESHGRSMSDESRKHVSDYILAGGSYVGSCAGAYLTCKGVLKPEKDTILYWPHYYGIWPGITQCAEIWGERHDVIFEKDSPLKKYYDFGDDNKVDSVYHHGGPFAEEDTLWPRGTEVLARFGTRHLKTKKPVDGKPVIWAYKATPFTGRIIPCGSHPENNTSGERLLLMCSMVRYALDGNGSTKLKGELTLGEARKQTASTHDNNPAFAKIGDLQYHHFAVDIPEGKDSLVIELSSLPALSNYDMYLFLQPEELAWKENSKYQNISLGFDKSIRIDKPKAGRYYVSVFCATTVDAEKTINGTQYYGRTDVLNGVPYIIKASCPQKK